MKNANRNVNILLCFLVSIFVVFIITKCHYESTDKENRRTDTVEVIKTITDTLPVIKKEIVLQSKYDTIPVIVDGTDTVLVPMEHKITQKVYSDDSTYTAYVSGCYQELDSITIRHREVYITNDVIRLKKPKIVISANAGLGYGLCTRKPDIFVGVSVGFPIWSK